MIRKILLLSLLLLGFFTAFSQIQHGGLPYSFKHNVSSAAVPQSDMPAVDVDALLAEDALEIDKNEPPRFGTDIDVSLSLQNSGRWEMVNKKDRIWRLHIHSDNAYSLNLIFNQFYIPEGAKLFIYTPDHSTVLGAFTHENNKSHGKFSTTVVEGADLILEYFEPWEKRGQGVIEVGKVIHGYKNSFFGKAKGFGDSGSCNINVNCPLGLGWEDEINASLLYLLSNNTRICSGAMMNNTANDGTPYFLSANHCYSSDWATWIFMFNYQSPSCANIDGPTNQTVSGSTLRSRRSDSDFMLFELSSQPPASYNVFLAGWDNRNVPADTGVCVHHPSNDIKKISFEYDRLDSTAWGGGPDDHWEVTDWDDGTTEPGSSGSPLFNQDHRVVGQLHGGGAACGNNQPDQYGKLYVSWNGNSASQRLHDWLDPTSSGVDAIDGRYLSVPTAQLDAGASNLTGIEEFSCETEITPEVKISNLGADTLTSLTIEYGIQGSPLSTYNWTGSLPFPASEIVTLPAQTLAAGNYTYVVQLSNPNGGTDQNTANDNLSSSFDIINGQNVTVSLLTDDYPEETAIEIRDQSNNLLYSEDTFDANTLYNFTYCLDTGCYIFRITDTYGDGICCAYGNGSYEVREPDGTVAGSGGQFSYSESVTFCVEDTSTQTGLESTISESAVRLWPNPAQDRFQVELLGAARGQTASLHLINALGQEFRSIEFEGSKMELHTNDLARGVYYVNIHIGQIILHKKLILR